MPLKGKRPVNPDQVPEGETLVQVVFKVGEDIYVYNMMGPTIGLLASLKQRDAAFQVLKNVFVSNAAAAMGYEIDGGTSVLDADAAGATQDGGLVQARGLTGVQVRGLTDVDVAASAADPSFVRRITSKLRGNGR